MAIRPEARRRSVCTRLPLSIALTIASALVPAAIAQAEPAEYRVDPAHTFVYFEVVHFGTSTVRGRFDDVDGTITFDSVARTGRAEITIDMGSIDSGVDDFDTHLKSADFFDVARTPQAKFVADRFEFDGDKPVRIAGTLTLLGKTQPVTLQARRFNCYHQPVLKADVCGGDFETTLDRSRWGMNWGIDMGIPDSVHLLIQVEAVKQ